MEFKGTKGKWEAKDQQTDSGSFYKVVVYEGESICNITTRDYSRAMANVLLISKAPQMLEILNRVSSMCESEMIDKMHLAEIKNEINKLIKEATEL